MTAIGRATNERQVGVLILVRKVNETIWFGGDIRMTVLDIRHDRVKLGVSAPDYVKVMRQELLAREDFSGSLRREAGPAAGSGPHR